MNEIIKIESRDISGAAVQTANARDLWAFVESKQEFSHWIKNRIEKYGFVEGEDFVVDKIIERSNQGLGIGQGRIDYHLTIETAKELAMVENNDKGRQVRKYFIECERMTELEAKQSAPTITNPTTAAMIHALQNMDRMERQQKAQAVAIQDHTIRLDEMEAKTTAALGGHGFYTIVGYANLTGVRVDEATGSRLGKRAVAASRDAGVMTGKIGSSKWGGVNTYHESILAQVFHEHFDQ